MSTPSTPSAALLPKVLLLRTPSEPIDTDAYHVELKKRGFEPHSIAVLETRLANIDRWAGVLSAHEKYDGVIVTSSRSVDALRAALSLPTSESGAADHPNSIETSLEDVTLYVVGSKTAAQLRSLPISSPLKIKGEESGTASKLADFIIRDLRQHDEDMGEEGKKKPHRLLYLTGDKNRDTLETALLAPGIGVEIELVKLDVYETVEYARLGEVVEGFSAGLPQSHDFIYVVFFAPSSSQMALPHLQQFFSFCKEKPRSAHLGKIKAIAVAIGPTTQEFLEKDADIAVASVSAKPDASALAEAIANSHQER